MRHVIARVATCMCLFALAGVFAGCSADGANYTSVSELEDKQSSGDLERVRVGGVFAEVPVTTPSGTVFTMADEQDPDARVRVYHSGTEPITATRGSQTASGTELLGTVLIVTGYYVDGVIVSDDMVVKQGGGYVTE